MAFDSVHSTDIYKTQWVSFISRKVQSKLHSVIIFTITYRFS